MEYDVWDYSHGANEFMEGISKFCTLLHRLGQSKGPCFHFNAQASTFKWGMRVPLRMTEHAILCSGIDRYAMSQREGEMGRRCPIFVKLRYGRVRASS